MLDLPAISTGAFILILWGCVVLAFLYTIYDARKQALQSMMEMDLEAPPEYAVLFPKYSALPPDYGTVRRDRPPPYVEIERDTHRGTRRHHSGTYESIPLWV